MTISPDARNPFRPNPGHLPPAFEGRKHEQSLLQENIDQLRRKEIAPSAIIISAPRGNGKTALLNWLKKEVETHYKESIDLVHLTPDDIESLSGLADSLMPVSTFGKFTRKFKAAGIGLSELLIRTEWDMSIKTESFARLLIKRCQEKPLILTIDEAHTLDTGIGKKLLNASQIISNQAPFLMVMAGTPDLEPHLNSIKATFWTRNEHLIPGLLSDADTRTTLEKPFAECNIHFESDTLEEIIRDTRGYPYFIQVWGDELFREIKKQNTNTINKTTRENAERRVNIKKERHYQTYAQRLGEQSLMSWALLIGQDIKSSDLHISDHDLDNLIEETPALPKDKPGTEIKNALRNIGYIWQGHPEKVNDWILAIPSLADYIEKEYGPQDTETNQEH